MAITISLLPNNVDSSASNFVYAVTTLAFSGNYPTGGDTLDLRRSRMCCRRTRSCRRSRKARTGTAGITFRYRARR
jgi:hypothetical protein